MSGRETWRRRLLLAGVVPALAAAALTLEVAVVLHHDAEGREALEDGAPARAAEAYAANRTLNVLEPWVAPYDEATARFRAGDPAGAVRAYADALPLAPAAQECRVRTDLALAHGAAGAPARASGRRPAAPSPTSAPPRPSRRWRSRPRPRLPRRPPPPSRRSHPRTRLPAPTVARATARRSRRPGRASCASATTAARSAVSRPRTAPTGRTSATGGARGRGSRLRARRARRRTPGSRRPGGHDRSRRNRHLDAPRASSRLSGSVISA